MNIAICDDDKAFRDKVRDDLRDFDFFGGARYTFYSNGEMLLDDFKPDEPFDFVFLDVDMPLMSGIAAGERLSKLSPRTILIFVSNYPQYAIDAFDCNATSYLLKGYTKEKLVKTVEKAMCKYTNLHSQISLKIPNGIVNVEPHRILYVEYVKKYCEYHTLDDVYSVRQPLIDALNVLEPFGFMQIYQCYAINLSKIKKIQATSVLLSNNVQLPIKRGSSKELIKEYTKFMNSRY